MDVQVWAKAFSLCTWFSLVFTALWSHASLFVLNLSKWIKWYRPSSDQWSHHRTMHRSGSTGFQWCCCVLWFRILHMCWVDDSKRIRCGTVLDVQQQQDYDSWLLAFRANVLLELTSWGWRSVHTGSVWPGEVMWSDTFSLMMKTN